mmetsp:Transcript_9119/g.21284  ORF Transcript_9119/g.21284 Transcript_9119/m.21284 type:complete len:202 (-) Transcript_9119:462-1067(-)
MRAAGSNRFTAAAISTAPGTMQQAGIRKYALLPILQAAASAAFEPRIVPTKPLTTTLPLRTNPDDDSDMSVYRTRKLGYHSDRPPTAKLMATLPMVAETKKGLLSSPAPSRTNTHCGRADASDSSESSEVSSCVGSSAGSLMPMGGSFSSRTEAATSMPGKPQTKNAILQPRFSPSADPAPKPTAAPRGALKLKMVYARFR